MYVCHGFADHLVFDRSTGALVQWLMFPAWKVGDRGLESQSGLWKFQKSKMFLLRSLVNSQYCGGHP